MKELTIEEKARRYDEAIEKFGAILEKQGNKKSVKTIVETWKDMRLEVYQQASGNRHEPNYSDDLQKCFLLMILMK